jgi:hypothetical protein
VFINLTSSVTVVTALFPPVATGLTMAVGVSSLDDVVEGAIGVVIGLAVYAAVGWAAFAAAVRRFEQERHN